jgi:hypothetical protein
MMPERIGIMGKMQGVKASSSPKPKKTARITHSPSPASTAAMRSCSETGGVVGEVGAAAVSVEALTIAAGAAGRLSATRWVCGG